MLAGDIQFTGTEYHRQSGFETLAGRYADTRQRLNGGRRPIRDIARCGARERQRVVTWKDADRSVDLIDGRPVIELALLLPNPVAACACSTTCRYGTLRVIRSESHYDACD